MRGVLCLCVLVLFICLFCWFCVNVCPTVCFASSSFFFFFSFFFFSRLVILKVSCAPVCFGLESFCSLLHRALSANIPSVHASPSKHKSQVCEATALKRSAWRQTVQKRLSKFEETLTQQHEEKRTRRKAAAQADRPASDIICVLCHRDCHSRIGLASHTRRYTRINT